MSSFRAYYESPIGFIEITSDDTFVTSCNFVEEKDYETEIPTVLAEALAQIDEYFQKERTHVMKLG